MRVIVPDGFLWYERKMSGHTLTVINVTLIVALVTLPHVPLSGVALPGAFPGAIINVLIVALVAFPYVPLPGFPLPGEGEPGEGNVGEGDEGDDEDIDDGAGEGAGEGDPGEGNVGKGDEGDDEGDVDDGESVT